MFKQNIENYNINFDSNNGFENLVVNYFGKNKLGLDFKQGVLIGGTRIDVILKYGNDIVMFEIKKTPTINQNTIERIKRNVYDLTRDFRANYQMDSIKKIHTVCVIFVDSEIPEAYNTVIVYDDLCYLVPIQLKSN